jgi:hypothetical protein
VALSALSWLPTLLNTTPAHRRIGVLTFDENGVTPELLLKVCRPEDFGRLVIRGAAEWGAWAALRNPDGALDAATMEQELHSGVQSLLKDSPDIGPLLLECAAMAPFAPGLRAALARPVFDINGMIFAFFRALAPNRYAGVTAPTADCDISSGRWSA